MNQRVRLVLIGVFTCLFAVFAALWLSAFQSAGESTFRPDPGAAFDGAVRPLGSVVPEYALRDQDGRTATPADHRGQLAIYAFIYANCDDVCPIQVQQIRGAMDQLGADVPVIGISVDPRGDTPRAARAFLVDQHMTGRMRFLLGTRAELEPVWEAFAVAPQTDRQDHSGSVVVVDGEGRQRLGYQPSFLTVDGLFRDLRRLGAGPAD